MEATVTRNAASVHTSLVERIAPARQHGMMHPSSLSGVENGVDADIDGTHGIS